MPDGDVRDPLPVPITHFAVGAQGYFTIMAQSLSAPHKIHPYSGLVTHLLSHSLSDADHVPPISNSSLEYCTKENLKWFFMHRVHYSDIPFLHKIAHHCYGTPELVKVLVNHAWYALLSRKAEPNPVIDRQLKDSTELVKNILGQDYDLLYFHPSTSPPSSNSSSDGFTRFIENLAETVPITPAGFATNPPESEVRRLLEYHPTQPLLNPTLPPSIPSSDTEMDLEETRSEASLEPPHSFLSTLHSNLPLDRSNTWISQPPLLRRPPPRLTPMLSLRLRRFRPRPLRSLPLPPLVGLLFPYLPSSRGLTACFVKNASSNALVSPITSMSVLTLLTALPFHLSLTSRDASS